MQDQPPPHDAHRPPPGADHGDPAALRRFGLVAGGGGILGAIAIALITSQQPAPAPSDTAPGPAAIVAPADPALPPAIESPAKEEPTARPQSASPPSGPQADNPAAPPAAARPGRAPAFCPQGEDRPVILVAFERSHPMHEAQRLYADGRRDEARALAARLLAERRELRGLCLERFSIGGAEIHVGAPSAATVTQWVERLSEMDGVERAEAELIAAPF